MRAKKGLKCIDRDELEKLEIRGKDEVDSIVINIDFMVCNPEERDDCSHTSVPQIQEYLKNPEIMFAHNTKFFDKKGFTPDTMILK